MAQNIIADVDGYSKQLLETLKSVEQFRFRSALEEDVKGLREGFFTQLKNNPTDLETLVGEWRSQLDGLSSLINAAPKVDPNKPKRRF